MLLIFNNFSGMIITITIQTSNFFFNLPLRLKIKYQLSLKREGLGNKIRKELKKRATKANNNISVETINFIILISSVYNKFPILFISVIPQSFLSIISIPVGKRLNRELSLNKNKVKTTIDVLTKIK